MNPYGGSKMKKIILATGLAAFLATPALADFWIVRDSPTADCHIVETKPADTKITIVGNKVYKTRDEAQKEMTTVCVKK
jgi:hypothetical protein